MRKFLPISLLVLLLACTEKIEIQSKSDYHEYLAVQATLTNQPTQPQQVVLSRSISFFHDEPQPMVKGAYVSVNDIRFTEREDGVYVSEEKSIPVNNYRNVEFFISKESSRLVEYVAEVHYEIEGKKDLVLKHEFSMKKVSGKYYVEYFLLPNS